MNLIFKILLFLKYRLFMHICVNEQLFIWISMTSMGLDFLDAHWN